MSKLYRDYVVAHLGAVIFVFAADIAFRLFAQSFLPSGGLEFVVATVYAGAGYAERHKEIPASSTLWRWSVAFSALGTLIGLAAITLAFLIFPEFNSTVRFYRSLSPGVLIAFLIGTTLFLVLFIRLYLPFIMWIELWRQRR